jgi:hypothetical protein
VAIPIKKLFFIAGLLVPFLTGCQQQQKFESLPNSPSYITVMRYRGDNSQSQSKVLTGTTLNKVYSQLNNAGKSIVPKDAKFNCGSSNPHTSWNYDIVVHYSNTPSLDRLFELNNNGCTFLFDANDNLTLNPKPMLGLSPYFK